MLPYVVIDSYVRTDGWLIICLKKITGDFFSNIGNQCRFVSYPFFLHTVYISDCRLLCTLYALMLLSIQSQILLSILITGIYTLMWLHIVRWTLNRVWHDLSFPWKGEYYCLEANHQISMGSLSLRSCGEKKNYKKYKMNLPHQIQVWPSVKTTRPLQDI